MQERARRTRTKILDGLVRVLVDDGPTGVTHRSVAKAAGVSLAATTRHFATKDAIIEDLSTQTLQGYLTELERLTERIRRGKATGITSLEDLVHRIVLNGVTKYRDQSIAWCELILLGARSDGGRDLARQWYREADRIWRIIGQELGNPGDAINVAPAVDRVVGLLFMLHPLRLDRDVAATILKGDSAMSDHAPPRQSDELGADSGAGGTRQALIDVAIDLLVREGPSAVTYQAVSQKAGLSHSAPSYHFSTVDALMEAAQLSLFGRAKGRYRDAFRAFDAERLAEDELLDLTTAIFLSEAMVHNEENLAFYSVWIRSAERQELRPPVLTALLDQQESWARTLNRSLEHTPPASAAMLMQSLFLGKLLRAITTTSSVGELARSRGHFAAALAEIERYK
jgi:AcrR family transcriptional regulator